MRAGYDAIAERYAEWAATFETPELEWVDELLSRLDGESDVLDLGCGGGRTAARTVAERHRYTGVDLSPVQIERARERIPNGRFLVADVTRLELEPESFDAVMSLFMLGHIPRAEQGPLLARMRDWLRPGGWLLDDDGNGRERRRRRGRLARRADVLRLVRSRTNRELLVERGLRDRA